MEKAQKGVSSLLEITQHLTPELTGSMGPGLNLVHRLDPHANGLLLFVSWLKDRLPSIRE